MSLESARAFYSRRTWDPEAWKELIAVEYETLAQRYPFDDSFRSLRPGAPLRALDVGCGTGIFPMYLDGALSDDIHLRCDLFDISELSLERAREALQALPHFSVGQLLQGWIEEIPGLFPREAGAYDVIWAVHSFTTVAQERMPAVYRSLLDLLRPAGWLLVYQLTAQSSYQAVHSYYRAHHPRGRGVPPYMTFEDSTRILGELGVGYRVWEFSFDHDIPRTDLEQYLRKCLLDEEAEVLDFFAPMLDQYRSRPDERYRFPQTVNLLAIPGVRA